MATYPSGALSLNPYQTATNAAQAAAREAKSYAEEAKLLTAGLNVDLINEIIPLVIASGPNAEAAAASAAVALEAASLAPQMTEDAATASEQAAIATTQANRAQTTADAVALQVTAATNAANAALASENVATAAGIQAGIYANTASQAASLAPQMQVNADTAAAAAALAPQMQTNADIAAAAAALAPQMHIDAETATTGAATATTQAEIATEAAELATAVGPGWTPVLAVVLDGARSVQQIIDWTGGAGTKPPLGYLGPLGVVTNIADATNIRGLAGASSGGTVTSVNGQSPTAGAVTIGIADIAALPETLADRVTLGADAQTIAGVKTFTASPVVPSVTAGDDSGKAAPTSYVREAFTAFAATIGATYAPLASPALTGNPTAPTQAAGNNSTRIANTAFVISTVASAVAVGRSLADDFFWSGVA